MKNITATILTLAMLAALTACGEGNDTPVTTTTTTVATTTATTTVGQGLAPAETTATATTAPVEDALPEFDINSEECLMYRLLDMTASEIEAEFVYGENLRYGGIGDSGNQTLYVIKGDAEYQLLFLLEDYRVEGSDSFEISDSAKPSSVSVTKVETKVYPGIDKTMTAAELCEVIPVWDFAEMNNYYQLYVVKSFDNYDVRIMFDIDSEESKQLIELVDETPEDKDVILRKYADEFVKNMTANSSIRISSIGTQKKTN